MPTYQYVCTNPEGKHEFERVQSFSDPAVSTCPECAAPVRKVYGSVGVVFKGSGFYRTDSRSDGGSKSTSGAAGKDGGAKDAGSKDAGSKGSGGKDGGSSTSTPKSGDSGSSSSSSSSGASTSTSGSGSKAAS